MRFFVFRDRCGYLSSVHEPILRIGSVRFNSTSTLKIALLSALDQNGTLVHLRKFA